MSRSRLELLKGTLDLLILRTLDLRPMHGSAIADRIFSGHTGSFQRKGRITFSSASSIGAEGLD